MLPAGSDLVEVPKRKAQSLRRRLPTEVKAALVSRYEVGEPTTKLSEEFGILKSGLHGLESVEFRRQSMTAEDIDRTVELYEGGLTIRQIVRRISYWHGTIRWVPHERDVIIGKPGENQTKVGGWEVA